MENVCYVIMPYGGDDPVLISKYEGIFRSIISPAAREAGFSETQIIREDHVGDAGMIVKNIVNHLTTSSVIVADLTGGNANVHYELGIAHSFHKSSTVLICERGTALPFDLQSLNIIQYATDIGSMAQSVEKIRAAIIQRRDGRSAADNSVHEYISELPTHLMELLDMDESDTQKQLQRVTQENEVLKRRLEAAGVREDETAGQQTIRSLLTATKARLRYSGASMVAALRKYAEEKNLEAFIDYLINAMELGTPTRREIDSILEICDGLDNTPLLQDVLSASLMLFPGDSELMTRLAKLYARRPSTRGQAMEMVNSAIGLKRGPDGKYASVNRAKLSHNDLARLLDTYNAMEAYDGLVEAAKFLLLNGAERESEMLTRNIFNAYVGMGDLEAAREYVPAMMKMGSDMSWYALAKYYNKCGDAVKEYECYENAMLTDPTDTDYPRFLAAHMLNESIMRTENGIETVSKAQAKRAAAAMLYYVLQLARTDRGTVELIRNMMYRRNNQMGDYFVKALPFLKGEVDTPPYELTDRTSLNCCLARMSED